MHTYVSTYVDKLCYAWSEDEYLLTKSFIWISSRYKQFNFINPLAMYNLFNYLILLYLKIKISMANNT